MWQMETIRMVLTWDTMRPLLLILFSCCFISRPIFSTPRFDQRLTVACHGRGPPRTVLDYLSVRDCGLLIVLLSVDLFSTLVCLCLFSFFFIHES